MVISDEFLIDDVTDSYAQADEMRCDEDAAMTREGILLCAEECDAPPVKKLALDALHALLEGGRGCVCTGTSPA